MMPKKALFLTSKRIREYVIYLKEQERSAATIQKYTHDLRVLQGYLDGAAVTKAALIQWKQQLTDSHAPATVNTMLAAINSFLTFAGWRELSVKLRLARKSTVSCM